MGNRKRSMATGSVQWQQEATGSVQWQQEATVIGVQWQTAFNIILQALVVRIMAKACIFAC
jgi:hypothetical protein